MSENLKSSIVNRQPVLSEIEGSKILYVVCGPTAVGKTDFAIELAEQLGTEIISADSRQLYCEIPIGTAQPSPEQLHRVKHHFIASRSIEEDYNAGMRCSLLQSNGWQ